PGPSDRPAAERQATHVQEAEKGETEVAPQVRSAQDQRSELDAQRARNRHSHTSSFSDYPVTDVGGDDGSYDDGPYVSRRSAYAPPQTRRRIDAFAPNNSPIGNIADESRAEIDPNQIPHNPWAAFRMKHRRLLAEFLGTALLMFIGVSVNLAYVTSNGQQVDALAVDWAWGFAVMIGIYVSGGGSGAFLNPALTIMLAVFRGFPTKRIVPYALAELLGALVGALLAYFIHRDNIMHFDGGLHPDITGIYFYTQPQPWVRPVTAFFTEFLCTAVLGCAIMAVGDSGNSPPGAGMHAFIIGLVVTTCTMVGGVTTSACMNPVRDLGPRFAAMAVGYPRTLFGAYHHWWIWGPWIATITGALAGGFLYDVFIFRGSESPVNFSVWRFKMESLKAQQHLARHTGHKEKAAGYDRMIERGIAENKTESAP
ncbi:hypothetical protein LTR53_007083, partial [Teratosphaeriaceae sp. CCFEE 6253]